MPVNGGESSSSHLAPENTKLRKPGHLMEAPDLNSPPRIVIPSIVQSRSSKAPTISSILHSGDPSPKKPFFPAASKFRGLGCTAAASQQVSVPSAIRASADWERRKTKRNHKKGGFLSSRNRGLGDAANFGCNSNASCVVAEDAWCGPGIGFSDADSDCVVVVGRRNVAGGRGKMDGQRERRPCITRRAINSELLCFLNTDAPLISSTTRPVSEEYGRHHRHIRYSSPEGHDDVMMLHGGILLGGDRHRGWRLDVDEMSYEQLLELGDRIGHVNTGLKDEEIGHCIGKIKISNINDLQDYFDTKTDGKCSICQEEYEEGDDLGKLECGHSYHLECIKQWLSRKNRCPVCKTEAAARASS